MANPDQYVPFGFKVSNLILSFPWGEYLPVQQAGEIRHYIFIITEF